MSLDGKGFHVEIEVLEKASSHMEAIAEEQGNDELAALPGDSDTYGHNGVHTAVTEFCDRWSVGLDALRDRAIAMSGSLRDAATTYREADQAGKDALSRDPAVDVVKPPFVPTTT